MRVVLSVLLVGLVGCPPTETAEEFQERCMRMGGELYVERGGWQEQTCRVPARCKEKP